MASPLCWWDKTGNSPDSATVIEELPFSTSGNSAGFTSTTNLGDGPDVFYTFTSATGVRQNEPDNLTCSKKDNREEECVVES